MTGWCKNGIIGSPWAFMNAHIFELLSPSAKSVYHFSSVLSRMAADSAESAGIHYRQLCINLPPVADHIRPLFGQVMSGKIKRFEQSSAVRKDTSATVQAAVPAVQTFNGVCCVDHLSDGWCIPKKVDKRTGIWYNNRHTSKEEKRCQQPNTMKTSKSRW